MGPEDLDLNLLKVFNALYQEGNVTRAATRLRLTQSATSSALARLRLSLSDPLFIRTQQGMAPTARAQALHEPVRQALEAVHRVLREETPFSPTVSDRSFRIMVTDHALIRLAPLLARLLSREAPHMRLDVSSVGPETDYERLRTGHADLMVSFVVVPPPQSFKAVKLFSERLVVLARRGHPKIKTKLSLQHFVDAEHVLVAPRGSWVSGPIDQILSQKGLKRKIRMAVPHYLAAPSAVAQSDMIVTLPESVADEYVKTLPVSKFDFPFETRLFTVTMLWHERSHDDPAHRWIRNCIKNACQAL